MPRALPVVPPSRWTPELLAAVAAGERRALRAHFDGSERGVVAAAEAASARAAELAAAALAREPPPSPLACRAGCAACCVSKVVVVAPEVIRIADHLRATLPPDAFAALLVRVRAAAERTGGLSRYERAEAGVPCPLLVDDACSVHAVRPLLCRGWTSVDAGACAAHFADPGGVPVPEAHAPSYELGSAVLAGLGRAALDAGLDGGLLELVAALRVALSQPAAASRWLAGLPVFATARDGEGPAGGSS
jgi:hypothetical protein